MTITKEDELEACWLFYNTRKYPKLDSIPGILTSPVKLVPSPETGSLRGDPLPSESVTTNVARNLKGFDQ